MKIASATRLFGLKYRLTSESSISYKKKETMNDAIIHG